MYLATAVDQTCQEQRAQENQLPREGKGDSAVVKALAPRAYCGTKGNVLLRRARSLALTIVSVTQFVISRDTHRGTWPWRWAPWSGLSNATSASEPASVAHLGEGFLPSAVQTRPGLLLQNLEMALQDAPLNKISSENFLNKMVWVPLRN